MKFWHLPGLFTLLFIASAGVASAQTAASTPIPMPPKPDLSAMNFLLGTWSCTSKSSRRPSAGTGTVTYAMDPTGYWIVGTQSNDAVPWFPYKTTSQDEQTYDATTSRWVDLSTDSTGGYDFSVSPGWAGQTMVWHDVTYSKGNDTASDNDTTVTKVSDTKLTSASSFKTTGGKTVTVTGSCTKT
ncbi:MAG TPA: hypothetical protein VIG51_08810 [Candidatus Baltobacteraceae bacterium]|jgi:hypothetical protein